VSGARLRIVTSIPLHENIGALHENVGVGNKHKEVVLYNELNRKARLWIMASIPLHDNIGGKSNPKKVVVLHNEPNQQALWGAICLAYRDGATAIEVTVIISRYRVDDHPFRPFPHDRENPWDWMQVLSMPF
jgi:hypothetical protein